MASIPLPAAGPYKNSGRMAASRDHGAPRKEVIADGKDNVIYGRFVSRLPSHRSETRTGFEPASLSL